MYSVVRVAYFTVFCRRVPQYCIALNIFYYKISEKNENESHNIKLRVVSQPIHCRCPISMDLCVFCLIPCEATDSAVLTSKGVATINKDSKASDIEVSL